MVAIGESFAVTIWTASGNKLARARSSLIAPSAANAPDPFAAAAAMSLCTKPISASPPLTMRTFSKLPAVATARTSSPCPPRCVASNVAMPAYSPPACPPATTRSRSSRSIRSCMSP